MKYYAVIDTNVLVSAILKQNSVPGSIVELAFDGPIVPVLNDTIENEYREVLSRPKFHLTEDIVEAIIHTFHHRGLYVDADQIDIELPDPKDRVFYEVALSKDDAYLITGNLKHFPATTIVVTPTEMIEILFNEQ